ncbi:PREDICTED: putative uncharacterized protein DDB_G0278921 [Trachymyrmex cornetzi]|uniref:putative uncharacterized protein DDB_G0278921 n=1 Tax=Trachymyrmex cornetzi TaxID=471704 RepID=UPI00084F8532|nr:PREDICTED: putative uncharacterized protein DDB_G0278921 [Trachymyrmex cornetzi]
MAQHLDQQNRIMIKQPGMKRMLIISTVMEFNQLQAFMAHASAANTWIRLKAIHDYKMSAQKKQIQHISKVELLAQAPADVGEPVGDVDKVAKILGGLPAKGGNANAETRIRESVFLMVGSSPFPKIQETRTQDIRGRSGRSFGPSSGSKLSSSSPPAVHDNGGHQTTINNSLQWPSPHTVHDILANSCNVQNSSSSSPTSSLCSTINNNHHYNRRDDNSVNNDNNSNNENNNDHRISGGYLHHHHPHLAHHQQYYASALYHHHHHRTDAMTAATISSTLSVQAIMLQSGTTNHPASPCN